MNTPGEIANYVAQKCQTGPKWISFTYTKKNGETKRRNVLFGAKLVPAMERRGVEFKNKGNWTTGHREEGTHQTVVRRNAKVYLQGFEREGQKPKLFDCELITNIQ